MGADSPRTPGPGTPRAFLARLGALFVLRAELFSLELEEHKAALVGHMVVGLAAFAMLMVALLSGLALIALLTPPGARPLVFALLAGGSAVSGAGLLLILRRRLRNDAAPFALTLREVRKDCRTLLDPGGHDDPA